MSEYLATIAWERGPHPFTESRYSRNHRWMFDGGFEVSASASPHLAPAPFSDAGAVDPEEAYVASLSSCHMLWFLALASRRGFCVDTYRDEASGIMEKNTAAQTAITRVTLRPRATFAGAKQPSRTDIDALHHDAHARCFIANSVKSEVRCEPIYPD